MSADNYCPPVQEIERRFLISRAPIYGAPRSVLWQGYLVAERDVSVRIRSVDGERFVLCVKRLPDAGRALVRDEFEVDLSAVQFEALKAAVVHRPILKERYRLEEGGRVIEVDVFGGHLGGLVIAEVEFGSVKASEMWSPPWWFGVEVTEDWRFLNAVLAQADGPPERVEWDDQR